MFSISTRSKIFIGSILSKILVFFIGDKKKIILRNDIKYEVDLLFAVMLKELSGINLHSSVFNSLPFDMHIVSKRPQ